MLQNLSEGYTKFQWVLVSSASSSAYVYTCIVHSLSSHLNGEQSKSYTPNSVNHFRFALWLIVGT